MINKNLLMKYLLFLFFLTTTTYAQKEGQNFCKGTTDGSYFPLDIQKKKIVWYNTYYYETLEGDKMLKGKTYVAFKQQWQDGSNSMIYFREANGKVLQYEECCSAETIRWKQSLKKGENWQNEDKKDTVLYTLLSEDAVLKTPYCHYTGLMALQAQYAKSTYVFYYLRGLGYVGATKDGNVISFIVLQ